MEKLLSFFKALSDETRIKLVLLLSHGSFCVCELSELLELSQPKISKHLSKLKDLGYVETKRDAQFIFYYLSTEDPIILELVSVLNTYATRHEHLNKMLNTTPKCTMDLKKGISR